MTQSGAAHRTIAPDDAGERRWERWLLRVPAALLVAVAIHQLFLAQSIGLSPWSGGGFGMFSTTDAPSTRHLHAFVQRPGIEREVGVPERLAALQRRVLALPSDANLRALALELAGLPTADAGHATGVRIQVWNVRHDPITLAPMGSILVAIEVPFEP